MSTFGILHTVISVLPVGFGFWELLRRGRITLDTMAGKVYWLTMLAGSVTSWGFLLTKGFTPAQVFTLLTLAALAMGTFTWRGHLRSDGYVQRASFSLSYFLLWFFLTTETLTRVPVGHPYANGPTDISLLPVRLVLLGLFISGVTYQLIQYRAEQRASVSSVGPLAPQS